MDSACIECIHYTSVIIIQYCLLYYCILLLIFRFFLLACDGLWKVFTANEATQMILSIIEVRGDCVCVCV